MFTEDLAKYYHAPFGHLEEWADIRRDYYIPAPNNEVRERSGKLSPIVTEKGERMETELLTFDVLTPGKNARALARYADEGNEYLRGRVAITETKVGKGRIIVMGAQLCPKAYAEFMTAIAAECGILPLTDASRGIATSILAGAEDETFCAVETACEQGSLTVPFDCRDLVSDECYKKGQTITLEPYGYIFAKKQ
jgi:hypothetical protein